MECIFCKIAGGQIPTQKVFENDHVIGIKDVNPQAPVHYLFMPKEHVESLATMSEKNMHLMEKIFSAIKSVASKEGLESRGFRTVINTNREGGQTVFHLHVHFMAGRPMGGNMTGV